MVENMAEEKEIKKNWLKSLFTDKEWDLDLSKVVGFGCVVVGIVGFFLAKEGFQWLLTFGVGLLGFKSKIEGI